jgi:hypothetical protein
MLPILNVQLCLSSNVLLFDLRISKLKAQFQSFSGVQYFVDTSPEFTSIYNATCFDVLSGTTDDEENLYCEVKLNARTNEYNISTPVRNDVHRHRRQGSLQRMLSPTAPDDTGLIMKTLNTNIMYCTVIDKLIV